MRHDRVIHPRLHHVNLKTTRLQEMVDFYRTLVGAEVIYQDAVGAWLSNDERKSSDRTARVPELRRRSREGNAHGHAPLPLNTRASTS